MVLLGLLLVAVACLVLVGTAAGRRNMEAQTWKVRYQRAVKDQVLDHQLVITQPDGNVMAVPLTATNLPGVDLHGKAGTYKVRVERVSVPQH